VGAAQIFFARFAALRPEQAKNGLAGSSCARACGARKFFLRTERYDFEGPRSQARIGVVESQL
jgi:hypothetical protein